MNSRSCIVWLGVLATAAAFAQPREAEPEARRGLETSSPGERAACTRVWRPVATGGSVLRVDLHDAIDPGLAAYIVRAVDEANARSDVSAILIHMNTPGGRVDSAQLIKDALLRSRVPIITFIDTHALSAGALVAYASDVIVVTPGATMGAATPILVGEGGVPEETGEKFVSAVRGMFRAAAEARGRDPVLAESMVDADVDVPGLKPKGKLTTLTQAELLAWCVADFAAADIPTALARVGAEGARIESREIAWAESLTRWLTDPTVAGLLMSLGVLGIMVEFKAPGFGVGGALALVSFGLFFGGHLFAQLAGLEELLLLLLGLILIGVELFVPGHVVPGVLGVSAVLVALGMALVGGDVELAWEVGALQAALWRTAAALGATFAAFLLLLRWLPRNRVVERLVLADAIRGGAHAAEVPVTRGEVGTAVTPVLGSGKARFASGVHDVVSSGAHIAAGATVFVIDARPGRIEVAARGESV